MNWPAAPYADREGPGPEPEYCGTDFCANCGRVVRKDDIEAKRGANGVACEDCRNSPAFGDGDDATHCAECCEPLSAAVDLDQWPTGLVCVYCYPEEVTRG